MKVTFFLFALIACATAATVNLLWVQSLVHTHYGLSEQSIFYAVNLENKGVDKNVTLWAWINETWINIAPAQYFGPAEKGREKWYGEFSFGVNQIHDLKFAVQYDVRENDGNVHTYWDSNFASSYSVANNSGSFFTDPVNIMVSFPAVSTSEPKLFGVVSVRNIAPIKDVYVRYTTSTWDKYEESEAYFQAIRPGYTSAPNPSPYGVEEWSFVVPSNTVEYAVRYSVAGKVFWDNNYGQNYKILKNH